MLIRFKKTMEKIAMGLLSFTPEEKDVKKLQETIKHYSENQEEVLFLWKEAEDMIGAIGVRVNDEAKQITIQHVSVNPSHRDNGIGQQMVQALCQRYESYEVVGNELTDDFLSKCK